MVYIVQDFFKNFTAFVKANDTVMLCDLLIDEVAKIIVFDKGKLMEALKKVEPKIKSTISDSDLITMIIKDGKNNTFTAELAKIITINNSEGHSVTDINTSNVKKSLNMFLNNNNQKLLTQKVNSHKKIKDMNFGTGDEDALVSAKRLKTKHIVMISGAVLIVGTLTFFGVRYFRKKKKGQPAKIGTTPAPATVT